MSHNLKVPPRYTNFFKRLYVNALLFAWFFPSVFYVKFAKMHYDFVRKFLNAKKLITMAMVPRGFGKTAIAVYILILFTGIFLRVRYILVVEETESKRNKSSMNLRALVKKSKRFMDIFGDVQGSPWSNTDCCFRSVLFGFEFFVGFSSIDGAMRGLIMEEARPQIVIINDIEDQKSEEIDAKKVEKKIRKITRTIIPMLQEKDEFGRHGKIWWLATLIGSGCVCDQVSKWDIVEVIKYPALDKNGRSTWEDMFSTARLCEKRDWYVSEGKYSEWLAEYMQEAEESERVDFPKPIPIFQIDSIDVEIPRVIFSLDAAYSMSRSADPCGFSVGGYDSSGIYHVLHSFEGKYKPKVLYEKMSEEVWRFDKIGFPISLIKVEAIAFQFVVYGARHSPQKDDFKNILISEAQHPSKSKVHRITKHVLSRAIAGNLLVEERSTQLVGQMERFPWRMKSWGAIDATALGMSIATVPPRRSGYAPGVKEGTPAYVIQRKLEEASRTSLHDLFFKRRQRRYRRYV